MTEVRKLDLNLVVVLDALLSERNLTRAGEQIGMTQPAVSGALTRLRELFDDPLLERDGRGFALTARAEALIPAVEECMLEVRRMFDALPEFDPATSTRTFFVAASDYVLSEIAGPLLRIFAREAPGARVQFNTLPFDAMVSPIDLLRNDVVIVGTGRGVPGKHASLFSDEFVCIADAANPEVHDGRLSLDAIARLRHVRSIFGHQTVTHIDEMLVRAEISASGVVTVQGFLPVPHVVVGTSWIGWVPERTARRAVKSLDLVIVETEITPSVLVEAAYWHPSKSGDPALLWLLQMLRSAAEVVEFGEDEQSSAPSVE